MPSGIPSERAITSRKVSAFAVDTSVIEAAAFKFNEGALKLLGSQLPTWLRLVMPSIIEQEILARRSAQVMKATQQIKAGYADLRRHGGPAFEKAEPLMRFDEIAVFNEFFGQQIDGFVTAHQGTRLDLSMLGLAEELFYRYFENLTPFAGGKDKKH